jgi:hypothetical protein
MKRRGLLLVLFMLFCWSGAKADSRINSKNLGSELIVQPGKWAMGRLRNIDANTSLSIRVQSEGAVVFLIVPEAQLKAFPKINDPVVMARVHRIFAATTTFVTSGNYYLLFWNRDSQHPASVQWQGQVSEHTAL